MIPIYSFPIGRTTMIVYEKKLIWFKKVSKFTYLKYFYNYMNSQNNKKKKTYV